ncbi:MAG TPA: hypothetical protein VGZ50_06330 [Actinomycetota bacterium]|nr:hypothetical protein [Actinomycetota bacterium]
MASILDELALTGDAPVRAADGTSLCPGSECGSTFNARGSEVLTFLLICVILAVAGTIAILAGRRRSTLWKLATIERWAMRVWWETRQVRRASQWRGERRPALDGDGLRRPVDSFLADGEN